ncbi:spermatogenesis-associated protein 1 [Aplochiton taeniatus]
MDYSYESVRYSDERRPTSSKFTELHVLYVPDEQWDLKLNKVPVEAVESFISAGFIRVHPNITLQTVRRELDILLGAERSTNKFSFLKCVGRSLALVKTKQENDLKVKSFAPPYAPQPELYLLPGVENDGSVCSQSLSTDTHSYFTDHQNHYPTTTHWMPKGIKKPVKFPQIHQGPQQPPLTHSPEEEEEEEEEDDEDEEESCSSTEGNEEEPLASQRPPTPPTMPKVKESAAKHEIPSNKKQRCRRNRARDSGVPESLEDRETEYPHTQRRLALISQQVAATLALATHKPTFTPVLQTSREELIEEIKLTRDERKQLEWTRQELLRKGKDLLAQNRHRRNQARDSWKKKYFETKKATAPLEDTLKNLRQELEMFYSKLLHQLQARDGKGKSRRQWRSSSKNELIIQIMTESHEIDNLKRKLEDAKMKLVTEIKLRNQAATELRSLKAELAQKKSQSSVSCPKVSIGFGAAAEEGPVPQSILESSNDSICPKF